MNFINRYIRGIIFSFGLILLTFCAFRMSQLPLWGHLPLGFFIGAWLVIVSTFSFFWKDTERKRWFLLSTVSGLLLSVGFPPLPFPIVLFVAFIPALIVQQEIEASDSPNKLKLQFFYIYHSFMLWNLLVTYWVSNSALVPSIAAFGLNSLFMAVPWIGMIRIGRKFPKIQLLSFVAFWLCWEWIHLNWEISWPWLTLGNAFASQISLIQWYEYTGVFGGGLWILVINCLIFHTWQTRSFISRRELQKKLITIFSLISLPILISLMIYFSYQEKGEPVEIAIIQPNYEPHFEKFEVPEEAQFSRFKKLTLNAITNKTKYILWPETSLANFNPLDVANLQSEPLIQELRDSLPLNQNLVLVSGMTSIKYYGINEPLGPAARRSKYNENKVYEIHNCAIQLSDTGDIPIYYKSRLVPGPEIFPYKKLLPFLKPIIDKMGGTAAGLATQKNREAFQFGDYKIAPVICYESIYGDYMRGYFDDRAQAIFIMTNDGWWDNTLGYIQHCYLGALRAIEFRKSIARSANSGISCTIDQLGRIHKPTKYGVETSLTSSIFFNDVVSFYQRFGDLIAYLAVLITVLLIIYSFVPIKLH
jgi:apolipoprotein N-acyltransferase